MLGIAPLGSTALGSVDRPTLSNGGGDNGGGDNGGGDNGGGDNGGGDNGGLPAAVFIDRRGVLSSAIDSAVSGNPAPRLGIKIPVRVATTGIPIVPWGLLTIDNVALAVGDRVLVKDQTSASQNGIYRVSAGAWPRSGDADGNDDLAPGMIVDVAQGDYNAGTIYTLGGSAGMQINVGTAPLVFSSISLKPPLAFDPILDSGGIGLVPGLKLQLEVPCRMRLAQWTLFADQRGSIVVDVWRARFSELPLSVDDSITGGAAPALVDAQFSRATDLSAWTVDLEPGDILGFSILSVSQISRVKLSLYARRPH